MNRAEFFQENVYELPSQSSRDYFMDLGQSYTYLPGLKQERPAVKVYNEVSSGQDILTWKQREDLNLENQLASLTGPTVEMAGPTPLRFQYGSMNDLYSLSLNDLRQNAIITNIKDVVGISLKANALSMPFGKESVKALICSEIPFNLHPENFEQMFKEAERMLKEKGIFFVKGLNRENFQNILGKTSLQIILYELRVSVDIRGNKKIVSCTGAFQKK